MGRICAVKSCPNGRKYTYKRKNASQPLSYFQPTTQEKLKEWSTALGIKLKRRDCICHLHFKQEDIKMYEKYNIQGEVMIVPRGSRILRNEAIPTIEHQFTSLSELEKRAIVHVKQKRKSNTNHSKGKQRQNIKQQELLVCRKISNNLMNEPTQPDLKDPLLNPKAHNLQNHRETKASIPLENLHDNIVKSAIVPQYWVYVNKSNSLEFTRLDPTNGKIRNRLRLNKDSSITVILRNNEEFHLNDKLNSYNSIYNYLKSVEKWPLCVGTQINTNKYSKKCKGVIIGDEAYKRNRHFPRCKSCRILRHTLLKSNSASQILEVKTLLKGHVSQLSQKSKYLKRMNSSFSQQSRPALKLISINDRNISKYSRPLHKFPALKSHKFELEQTERYNKWKTILDEATIRKGDVYIHNSVLICNKHFKDAFRLPSGLLTKNAVPTINISKNTDSSNNEVGDQSNIDDTGNTASCPGPSLNIDNSDNRKTDLSNNNDTDNSVNFSSSGPCEDTDENVTGDYLEFEEDILNDTSESKKDFSWQKPQTAIDLAEDESEAEFLQDDLSLYCSDDENHFISEGISSGYDGHAGFHCNSCTKDIVGYRYVCVQCSDYDLCGACEASGVHDQHYVLRIPGPRPYREVQTVLARIRKHLMLESDPISSRNEDEDAISIKSEIKEEDEDGKQEQAQEADQKEDGKGVASATENQLKISQDKEMGQDEDMIQNGESSLQSPNKVTTDLKHADSGECTPPKEDSAEIETISPPTKMIKLDKTQPETKVTPKIILNRHNLTKTNISTINTSTGKPQKSIILKKADFEKLLKMRAVAKKIPLQRLPPDVAFGKTPATSTSATSITKGIYR